LAESRVRRLAGVLGEAKQLRTAAAGGRGSGDTSVQNMARVDGYRLGGCFLESTH
jgi:hypothetical protein